MSLLTARVHHGRLQLDVPVDLPEGTEINLVADDGGDRLTDVERAELHRCLASSWQEALRGDVISVTEFLANPTAE